MWTLQFVRRWWTILTPASILRLRREVIRANSAPPPTTGTVTVTLRTGLSLTLRLGSSDLVTFSEIFEDDVYHAAASIAAPLDVVVDLGANVGCASAFFHRRNRHLALTAVEAFPPTYDLLARNLAPLVKAGQAVCWNEAVWGRPARIRIGIPASRRFSRAAIGDATGFDVEAIPLDAILERAGHATVDLLKVDIEGAEVDALSTAQLPGVRVVAIEFHGAESQATGLARLDALGFRLAHSDAHTYVLTR